MGNWQSFSLDSFLVQSADPTIYRTQILFLKNLAKLLNQPKNSQSTRFIWIFQYVVYLEYIPKFDIISSSTTYPRAASLSVQKNLFKRRCNLKDLFSSSSIFTQQFAQQIASHCLYRIKKHKKENTRVPNKLFWKFVMWKKEM